MMPLKLDGMNREHLLKAVMERDARLDGTFVYGVTSTRIFCRPSCPSRRPKVENIRLFDTLEAAQSAGYRSCQRCNPIEFAARLGNGSLTNRELEVATGISSRDAAELGRMERFKAEVRSGSGVLQASLEAGFGSTRALYERAPAQLGMTPATYGKGGAGALIRFAVAACELGWILVARTDVGVCSVSLGDDPLALEELLRTEFPAAEIAEGQDALANELKSVLSYLEGSAPSPLLPLDVRATAFQWRVWHELTRIGRGETVTYATLAARLEMPKAVRAVAAACGKNPVALVHPCHRVVGKNGDLTGYRWGVERKGKLLKLEKTTN